MKTYISHQTAWLMTLVLSLFLSIGLASAATQTQKSVGGAPKNSAVSTKNKQVLPPLSQAVLEAQRLSASLTAAQRTAIKEIVKQYEGQLQQGNRALSAALSNQASTSGQKLQTKDALASNQAALNNQAATQAAQISSTTAQLVQVQEEIDNKVSAVLNDAQKKIYAKQTAQLKTKLQQSANQVANSAQPAAGTQDASYCWYSSVYGAYGLYYSWLADYYGYYDYVYYGNTYAYYGYVYGYYGEYYNQYGVHESGGAYFNSAYGFGSDYYDWGSDAYYDYYYARYYQYYQYLYNYYSYYYYGSPYGYYAYYYGYNGAYNYQYYGYNYAYYCS